MLSQSVEYALRAMVYLAAAKPGEAANSETIATHTKVPQGYLSKIMRDLVVAELVTSQRGPSGGFALAREPGAISMFDVASAVNGLKRIRSCPLGNPMHVKLCPLHQRMDDALGYIEESFRSTSLEEVITDAAKPGARCRTMSIPTVKGRKI